MMKKIRTGLFLAGAIATTAVLPMNALNAQPDSECMEWAIAACSGGGWSQMGYATRNACVQDLRDSCVDEEEPCNVWNPSCPPR